MSKRRDDAPERPTMPQMGRAKRARGDDELLDDGPTVYDPSVPTGAPGFPAQMGTDDEPTGAKEKVPLQTVVGKRPAKREPDPRELPTMRHPMKAAPGAMNDDLLLTNRWDPPQRSPGEEAPMRDSGPPTNPLPPRGNEPASVPVPRSGPQLPLAPGPNTAPIRVVSMKTPQEVEAEERAQRALPQVRIRPMSEVTGKATPPQGMGNLAPPRAPNVARPTRWQDYVIWGSVTVMVAAVVTLAVWFLAR